MILILKPFRVGDFIESAGFSGTVMQIQVFHTVLRTPDNQKVIIPPNAELSNASAINYSAYETRRANVKLLVSYEQNLPHVKEVIHSVIEQQPLILKDPAPAVVMGGFGGEDGAIIYARVWAERSNYWTMYFAFFWKLSKRHLKNRGSKSLTASLPCISSKARRAAMHWDKPLRTLCGRVFTAACLLLFAVSPLWAAAFLTEEEITYIAGRKTVQAINVEGAAPIQYRDGRGGRVRGGISQQILREISEMTGLDFDYELTETPQEVWESGAELIVGIPPNYAPPGLKLSPPFLVSETILYFNSALDPPTDLAGKRYAGGVKGGVPYRKGGCGQKTCSISKPGKRR